MAAEVSLEEQVLADPGRQAQPTGPGLPLALRDALHVRADRLGVALRRALADVAAGHSPGPAATR